MQTFQKNSSSALCLAKFSFGASASIAMLSALSGEPTELRGPSINSVLLNVRTGNGTRITDGDVLVVYYRLGNLRSSKLISKHYSLSDRPLKILRDGDERISIVVKSPGYAIGIASLIGPESKAEIVLKTAVQRSATFKLPDGTPAKGVKVTISHLSEMRGEGGGFNHVSFPPEEQKEMVTDSNGVLTLSSYSLASRISFNIKNDKFALLTAPSEQLPNNAENRTITLSLGSSIEGKISYAGKPLSGVRVGMQSNTDPAVAISGADLGTPWVEAFTDKEGRFKLKRIKGGHPYNVAVVPPSKFHKLAAKARTVVPGKGKNIKDINFELNPGIEVRVKVTNSRNSPIKGTPVGAYSPAHPMSSSWVSIENTDEKGIARFYLPAGKCRVYLSDGRFPDNFFEEFDLNEISREFGYEISFITAGQ